MGSPPGSVASRTQVLASVPDVTGQGGGGECDTFDAAGKIRPAGIARLNAIIGAYQAQLASHCAKFAHCRYDGGALSRMVLTAGDLAVDHVHLSVAGHAKQAEIEWGALGLAN